MTNSHRQLVVVIALLERDGKVLITRRHDPDHAQWHHLWEFPGGKIDRGETPQQALKREVFEETQLTFHSEKLLGIYTQNWQTPTGTQQTFIILYHCQANAGEVLLCADENDAYTWEAVDDIVKRNDLLDGNVDMLQTLFTHAYKYV